LVFIQEINSGTNTWLWQSITIGLEGCAPSAAPESDAGPAAADCKKVLRFIRLATISAEAHSFPSGPGAVPTLYVRGLESTLMNHHPVLQSELFARLDRIATINRL